MALSRAYGTVVVLLCH